jgi:precorrin-6A/cobalt-precorrin-6A reductase
MNKRRRAKLMKLLLIAGMGESVGLARDLSAIKGFEVICVTEGRAVARAEPPARIYDSGFETDDEFLKYLADQRFDMVIDAAHPFEFRLGALARDAGLPYLRVIRAFWQEQRDEAWIKVGSMAQAVAAVPKHARVFLATGRGSVDAFAGRPDVHVMCRQLAKHDLSFPLDNGAYIFGEGPFSISSERETFQELKVDCLILRNSGSRQGRSKVDAACGLGIKVIMIEQGDMGIPASQLAPLNTVVDRVVQHADH